MAITETVEINGTKAHHEWLPCSIDEIHKYQPIVQASGLCVDTNGLAVLVEESAGKWQLTGGTVEKKETLEQTFRREVMEEVDIEVGEIRFLGLIKVTETERVYYLSRFFARISKVLPTTIDPAENIIRKREFVPITEVNNWLKWGPITDELIRLITTEMSIRP